ncbi:thioredoxin family protein [Desulfobacterales bacterium HSG2]|nr:thioredoxin family protein [Desulfobacterales bacterium HSG2]
MTPNEEKQITDWNNKCSDEIQIRLILTEDERGKELSKFCDDLSVAAPKVRIIKEKDEAAQAPAIQVGHALRYQAVPLGPELEPFLEALNMPDKKYAHIQKYLDKIEMPAELRVYIAPQCPFCPATVRQLLPLTSESRFIRLTITDGVLFPEMAQSDNIQAAPTVLLDDRFRWTGSIQLEEILDMMTNRDPSSLGASSMERMIMEGNASQLAGMMLDNENIFPAFFDLLVHPHFSVRLGAMVSMEEIAERNIRLAGTVAKPLLSRLHEQEDQIKGDIIHILGESGGPDLIAELEKISESHDNPEIKEAVKEAIEKIGN